MPRSPLRPPRLTLTGWGVLLALTLALSWGIAHGLVTARGHDAPNALTCTPNASQSAVRTCP